LDDQQVLVIAPSTEMSDFKKISGFLDSTDFFDPVDLKENQDGDHQLGSVLY
jgi:hypothetical protein